MNSWTFITNHGAVLALIGMRGQITAREIAADLGITERSVMRIIKDLETEGYIQKVRKGRANHYNINSQATLRRLETREIGITELLKILNREK